MCIRDRFISHVIALPGNEGSAKGAHDACDVRAHGLASRYFFKASEHGIVVEGASLDHHVVSKVGSICNLNYLK